MFIKLDVNVFYFKCYTNAFEIFYFIHIKRYSDGSRFPTLLRKPRYVVWQESNISLLRFNILYMPCFPAVCFMLMQVIICYMYAVDKLRPSLWHEKQDPFSVIFFITMMQSYPYINLYSECILGNNFWVRGNSLYPAVILAKNNHCIYSFLHC